MARGKAKQAAEAAAALPPIPDKLYFRIGEVARLLAVPAYVLRFWEGEFPHLRPTKGGTGQRLYRRGDVDALLQVRRLLYDEGYTIPGARRLLDERPRAAPVPAEASHAADTPPASSHLRDDALQQVHSELRELAQVLSRPAQPDLLALHGPALGQRRKPAPRDEAPSLFAWTDEDDASQA